MHSYMYKNEGTSLSYPAQNSTPSLDIIGEKVQYTVQCIDTGKDFLNMTSTVQALRSTTEGWGDVSAVKSIGCSSKGPRFNSQQPHGSQLYYSEFQHRHIDICSKNIIHIK